MQQSYFCSDWCPARRSKENNLLAVVDLHSCSLHKERWRCFSVEKKNLFIFFHLENFNTSLQTKVSDRCLGHFWKRKGVRIRKKTNLDALLMKKVTLHLQMPMEFAKCLQPYKVTVQNLPVITLSHIYTHVHSLMETYTHKSGLIITLQQRFSTIYLDLCSTREPSFQQTSSNSIRITGPFKNPPNTSSSLRNLTMTSGIRPSRTLTTLAPIFTPRQPLTITHRDSAHDLVISQLNCQGFLKKMDMIFNFMITDWKSDILCLSKTWLRPSSTVDTHLSQENFTLFGHDRPSRSHGGLLVYKRNHVQVRCGPDLELRELKCITLKLTVPSPITRHLLFCCYRPQTNILTLLSLSFDISWPRPKMNRSKLHSWVTSMQNTRPRMKHPHPTQLSQKWWNYWQNLASSRCYCSQLDTLLMVTPEVSSICMRLIVQTLFDPPVLPTQFLNIAV